MSSPDLQFGSSVEIGETQWKGTLWYLAEIATL
jgi:hypothetical protein